MTLRLNLGCGGAILNGWVSVDREAPASVTTRDGCGNDIATWPGARFVKLDIVKDPWPWMPGSVDGIVLHHVLDLMTRDEMRGVLQESYVVLKPGGVLRVSSADIVEGARAAIEGDVGFFAEKLTMEGNHAAPPDEYGEEGVDLERTVGFFITQGGARKQVLLPEHLQRRMLEDGYSKAHRVVPSATYGPDWMRELDSREGESWFVEAVR